MIGWHRQLNGHEFEQTPGDSGGQGKMVCTVHGVAKSQTCVKRPCLFACYLVELLGGISQGFIVALCPRKEGNARWCLSTHLFPGQIMVETDIQTYLSRSFLVIR